MSLRRPHHLLALAALLLLSLMTALAPAPSRALGLCHDCVDDAVNDTASSPGIVACSRNAALPFLRAKAAFIGKDHRLHFAEAGTPAWTFSIIDPVARAGGCSMDIDDLGRPVVCYHDSIGSVFFGRRNATGWQLESVMGLAGVTGTTTMAIIPGGVAVAFASSAQGLLLYAEKIADGPWATQIVAPVGTVAAYPSLIANSGGRAISYADGNGLHLATRAIGQPWQTQVVDAAPGVGGYSSLIGDPLAGQYGIAYYDLVQADLRYAHSVAGGWALDLADGANGRVGRACAAVASGGAPAQLAGIAYYDQLRGDLDLASKSGPAWQHAALDTTGDAGAVLACGMSSSQGAASADTIGIFYVRRPGGDLEYLWRATATAGVETLPHDGLLHAAWRLGGDAGTGGTLRFTMPVAGRAHITILDAQGRRIAEPLDRALPAGAAEVRWDGRDSGGRTVNAGIYFARLATSCGETCLRGVVLR